MVRLWQFARTPEGLKMIKFTMVSVISALTSLVVLTFVYGVLRLWTEVPERPLRQSDWRASPRTSSTGDGCGGRRDAHTC